MKSYQQQRLYEFIKQYQYQKKKIISLDDLKTWLGIKKDAYPVWGDFSQKILKKAQKEFEKSADVVFTFKPIKKNNKTESVEFTIFSNSQKSLPNPNITNTPESIIKYAELFENEYYYQVIEDGCTSSLPLTKEYISTQTGDIYIFTKEQENEEAPAYFIPYKKINCDEINAYFQTLGSPPTPSIAAASEDKTDEFVDATNFEVDLLSILPKEVHKEKYSRVKAIEDIARIYIPMPNVLEYYKFDPSDTQDERLDKMSAATRQASEEGNDEILRMVRAFVNQEYAARKETIISPDHFNYFKKHFEGWLRDKMSF